jgi:hypothetical protein
MHAVDMRLTVDMGRFAPAISFVDLVDPGILDRGAADHP